MFKQTRKRHPFTISWACQVVEASKDIKNVTHANFNAVQYYDEYIAVKHLFAVLLMNYLPHCFLHYISQIFLHSTVAAGFDLFLAS